MIQQLKKLLSFLKPYLRWAILGGVLFFLGQTLIDRWQEVVDRISHADWTCILIALGITLLAHICAGWVWIWSLQALRQSVHPVRLVQIYMKTTIAKYLPGNVWHYYGRIKVATQENVPLEVATVSTLLEPVLMSAAALLVALLGSLQLTRPNPVQGLQVLGLIVSLIALHPWVLNPLVRLAGKLKLKAKGTNSNQNTVNRTLFRIERYPFLPLLGSILFLILRCLGFLLIILALAPVPLDQVRFIFSAFSFAWLIGMIAPGFPGGLGVFESIAFALLSPIFPGEVALSAVAIYRLTNTLAETAGAGLCWVDEWRCRHPIPGQK